MAHITTELDEYPLIRLARNAGVTHVSIVGGEAINKNQDYLVFLNGEYCFYINTLLHVLLFFNWVHQHLIKIYKNYFHTGNV